MPYVRGGTTQGWSSLAEVVDVHHSNNVYANGVPVALWQPPGSSESSVALSLKIPSSDVFSRPDSPRATDDQPYVAPAVPPTPITRSLAGVAPKNPGPSEAPPIADHPASKCDSGNPNVIPLLTACLREAKAGTWREQGQNGRPSNPNILNMWKNIGLGFNTDQIPWCAGFACFVMKQSGLKWTREAGARNLVKTLASGAIDPGYKEIQINKMQPGDLVLWSSGHVNFCYTASNGRFTFVGGNQAPGKAATPPVRDPENDGDVTISWPGGWDQSKGGVVRVVRLDC